MKKWLPVLMGLLICMASFSGCGNHNKDAENKDPIPQNNIVESSSGNDVTDKYQTAPVPEGKPAPVEPQTAKPDKKAEYYCTLLIQCNTILDNPEKFDQSKMEVLPENGVIYEAQKVSFNEGESVFDVLLRETRENQIHMEFVETPLYNSNYIEGINNIYEFDCGELSGWMYKVNGWFPNYGSSRYQLQDGDQIEWVFTCDLGNDVGGDWNAQRNEEGQ